MKIKLNTEALAVTSAIFMLVASPGKVLGWDQLLPFVYNSHSVITYDAAMAANETLRANRAFELEVWTSDLYSRTLPRIRFDAKPMGLSELSGGFYPERHLDDATILTLNRLEEGNTVADKPRIFSRTHPAALFDAYCDFFVKKMGWAADEEGCKNLPLVGPGMPLHFNREYTETTAGPKLRPAAESCRKGVDAIKALTREGWSYWEKGRAEKDNVAAMREYEKMYLMVGIAMHAVEDSFAPAHMQRSQSDPRVIEDLCYYYDNTILPPSVAKACAHGVGDGKEPRDSIYFKGNAQYPGNAVPRSLATKAAKAYLTGFANVALEEVKGGRPDVESFLENFLVAGRQEGEGYLDCSVLEK